jgi:tetratricopeptide (TPR) repeat protein
MKTRSLAICLFAFYLLVPSLQATPLVSNSSEAREEAREAKRKALWHFMNGLYAQNIGNAGRALAEYQQAALFDPASSAIHSQLAYHYYVTGLDYKTVEELQKALQLDPRNVDTRLLLAGLYAKQGESDKARDQYLIIIKQDPKNTDARYYLAGVFVAENKNDEAIEQYKEILKVNPKDNWAAYAQYNMGLIYTRVNRRKNAEDAYRAAIALNPAMESAYLSLGLLLEWDQRPTDAVRVYRELLKKDPDNTQAWMALGKLYYDSRDYTTAFQVFKQYQKKHPDDLNAMEYLGLTAYRLGEYQEAVEAFGMLVRAQPKSNINRYRLASALEASGAFDQAEEQLKAVAEQDSREVDAWVRLALLYQRQNRPADARLTLQTAQALLPDDPQLLVLQSTADLDAKNYEAAEASLQKVLAKDPKNAQAVFYLGVVKDKQGRFDDAMETMKRAIEVDPSNPEPYNYVGYSYAEKGVKLDEAERLVSEAVRLDPENPFYKDSLAWVYYQKKQYQKAIGIQEKAISLLKTPRKDDAVMFEHLGDIYLKLGRQEDAIARWERAVEIDPSLASSRKRLGLPAYVEPSPTPTPKVTPKKKAPLKKKPIKKSVSQTTASKPVTAGK